MYYIMYIDQWQNDKWQNAYRYYQTISVDSCSDIWEYGTENHTQKSNHTEKPLIPHSKVLQKIITLKFSVHHTEIMSAIFIQEC